MNNVKNIKLKSLRIKYNISQQDMADYLGLCLRAYAAKENGQKYFSERECIAILNFFKARGKHLTFEEVFINKEE